MTDRCIYTMKMQGMSLRYKILIVVTGIPLVSLVIFYLMVSDLFKTDKQAYIYNQVQTHARSKASSVSAEIASAFNSLKAIDQTVHPSSHRMTRTGHYVFYSNSEIDGFVSILVDKQGRMLRATKPYIKPGKKKARNNLNFNFAKRYLHPPKVLHRLNMRPMLIQSIKSHPNHLAVTILNKTSKDQRVLSGIFKKEALSLIFKSENNDQIMLASRDTGLILGKPDSKYFETVHAFAQKATLPEITKEFDINETKYIASMIETSIPEVYVSNGVLLSEAYKATEYLTWKTLIFCIALFSLTIIIAIFSTHPVTNSIERLSDATNKIAAGDFNIEVKTTTGGEIGQLAGNFRAMALKVKTLIEETQDKARMEAELKTAQAVQELLLPEPVFRNTDVSINGAAIAAEECGGDWWYHYQTAEYFFVFIGDATGHGAPAALITSAARSAVAMMQKMEVKDPSVILENLSEAIYGTSKGNMVMTGFLMRIDKSSGEVVYSNASHDPPYLLRGDAKPPFKWKNLEPLMDNIGPRLGEHSGQTYTTDTFQLSPGDRMLLYTDGIFEIKNKEGIMLKERTFLKYCADLYSKPGNNSIVPKLVSYVDSYTGKNSLVDDITLISVDWTATAAATKAS